MKSFTFVLLLAASKVAFNAQADTVLTNHEGMTLYTFDKDKQGVSTCYGGCAAQWPPLLVREGDQIKQDWSMVERKDGNQQWAYKGQPLYTWAGDNQAGDTNGDGVGGVWHVAKKMKKAKKQYSYGYKKSYGYSDSDY